LHSLFKPTPVVASLFALGLVSGPAYSMAITNSLTSSVTLSADGSAPVTTSFTDPAYAATFNSVNGTASSANGSGWGNNLGAYAVRSNGSGVFSASGAFQRQLTITNDTSGTEAYMLPVYLYGGGIVVDPLSNGYASYNISISRGSTTLFSSAVQLNADGTFSQTGTALNGAGLFGNSFYWNGTNLNFDLGTLESGESMTINYNLVSAAFGEATNPSDNCGYGDSLSFASYGGCLPGTSVGFGDPSNPSATALADVGLADPIASAVNGVPAPASVALLGLGLLGFAWRKKAASSQ
jgi:hypothetical protein